MQKAIASFVQNTYINVCFHEESKKRQWELKTDYISKQGTRLELQNTLGSATINRTVKSTKIVNLVVYSRK